MDQLKDTTMTKRRELNEKDAEQLRGLMKSLRGWKEVEVEVDGFYLHAVLREATGPCGEWEVSDQSLLFEALGDGGYRVSARGEDERWVDTGINGALAVLREPLRRFLAERNTGSAQNERLTTDAIGKRKSNRRAPKKKREG